MLYVTAVPMLTLLVVPCGRGTVAVNRTCLACPAGTYSDHTGALQCSACPDGTFTAHDGASDAADCMSVCGHGTFSASKAAAYSLAQCQRAEMRAAGIRVLNVFPGPIDDEWNQNMPPPKVTPQALATAIIRALRDGVEDIYPGDVAQEWLERWRENPKVLEREIALGGGG